ncbi:hypothetical protein HPB47_022686, partial [Ixodes persulcatus]
MSESTPGSESFDDNDIDEAEKEGSGWTLNCRKRRHLSGGSASSQATIIDAHRENRTVIAKPQDPTKLIAKLNPLTLSQELDSITPNGVIQIRPNYRLNLLAIDMRDNSSMKTILTLTILLGIKVQTYEAHPRSSANTSLWGIYASEFFSTPTNQDSATNVGGLGTLGPHAPMCNAAAAVAALTTASTAKPTNLAIAMGNQTSLQELAEHFADEFSRPISPPQGNPPSKKPPLPSYSTVNIDDDFTLSELRYALSRCPRRGAPGPDRITNQALKNLDESFLPGLTIRSSTQGVPQGSVLSPLLFNIIMAGLPAALPVGGPYPIHCAIYADDVALWCAGPTRLSTTVRAVLQRALDGTASFLHHADPLLQRLMTRHHSQVGKAVKTFRETFGYPTDVCSIPPPYRDDCQLHVSAEIADLPRRKHVSEVVARSIA